MFQAVLCGIARPDPGVDPCRIQEITMNIKHIFAGTALFATALLGVSLWLASSATEHEISEHRSHVQRIAPPLSGGLPDPSVLATLPEPVQRFVKFTFPNGTVPAGRYVELQMAGEFRRPKTSDFSPTTATQTIAMGTPAMLFVATTPIIPGVWARAYDAYVDGHMVMKAKVLSAVSVVDEKSSPVLDQISLRRWLLESSFYPVALMPGGLVHWEPVDKDRARAVVVFRGLRASLLGSFDTEGRLIRFDAEADGDLTTPYHGSGEHVERSDYQLVGGMMVPMRFTVARAAGGKLFPFWSGRVKSYKVNS
jgi:hypothetical protein